MFIIIMPALDNPDMTGSCVTCFVKDILGESYKINVLYASEAKKALQLEIRSNIQYLQVQLVFHGFHYFHSVRKLL